MSRSLRRRSVTCISAGTVTDWSVNSNISITFCRSSNQGAQREFSKKSASAAAASGRGRSQAVRRGNNRHVAAGHERPRQATASPPTPAGVGRGWQARRSRPPPPRRPTPRGPARAGERACHSADRHTRTPPHAAGTPVDHSPAARVLSWRCRGTVSPICAVRLWSMRHLVVRCANQLSPVARQAHGRAGAGHSLCFSAGRWVGSIRPCHAQQAGRQPSRAAHHPATSLSA